MPFYIIRRLVASHRQLQDNPQIQESPSKLLARATTGQTHDKVQGVVQMIDSKFRNFHFNVACHMASLSATVLQGSGSEQICHLSFPQNASLLLKRNSRECACDVLGFQLSSNNSIQVVSSFAHTLLTTVSTYQAHPVMQRGVEFYEDLHKEFKEK